MADLAYAIIQLVGESPQYVDNKQAGYSFDADGATEQAYNDIEWTDERPQPTWGEVKEKLDGLNYSKNRVNAYPPLKDQMDMQYHDAVDGTTTWQDAVKTVKDTNPKPE